MSISGAKPFSLQAPEAIAKQYQGNKQKIAQAVQLGLVDATAGTLAGMFIDRMRSAAMQEQGPPQTVAQQVLGSSPPAPPPGGPPMQPQMGGSPPLPMPAPQGAPPASSAAPMGGPPVRTAPMAGPPVRAADGGLMSLPIPDAMFDEPEGASMARGGLVAFAGAGAVEDEEAAPFAVPEQEDTDWSFGATMGRLGERIGSGLEAWNQSAAETRSRQAQEGVVYKDGKYYSSKGFGVRPAPNSRVLDAATGKYFRVPASDPRIGAPKAPNAPAMTGMQPAPAQLAETRARQTALRSTPPEAPPARKLGGMREAVADPIMFSAKQAGPKHAEQIKDAADQAAGKPTIEGQSKDPIADAIAKYAGYLEDPEYKAYMEGEKTKLSKQKKEDVWTTLAQIGFGMAASKSPTLLGAIGEAGTAAVPNIQKALQARRAAEADYAKQRMDTRRTAITGGIGMAQNAEQIDLKREEMAQKERQFEAELDSAWKRAQLQAGAQIRGAQISAAAQAERETDFKFAVRSLANSLYNSDRRKYPTIEAAQAAAIREYTAARQPGSGDGPNIAEALAGAGGGNRNGYNPNAVREKQ